MLPRVCTLCDHTQCVVDSVVVFYVLYCNSLFFFFQAEDGIRDLVRSRGLGDVYKRQVLVPAEDRHGAGHPRHGPGPGCGPAHGHQREAHVLSLIHI